MAHLQHVWQPSNPTAKRLTKVTVSMYRQVLGLYQRLRGKRERSPWSSRFDSIALHCPS